MTIIATRLWIADSYVLALAVPIATGIVFFGGMFATIAILQKRNR